MIASDNEFLTRDAVTGALINNNVSELRQYQFKKKQRAEIDDIKRRLECLEQKLDQICELLLAKGSA
jgi:hypothetical protein